MSLPYFPMYPTDFEAKTSHLTLEEDGAYNRLLRLMWMTPGCSFPDDDAWILRRMRCSEDRDCEIVLAVIAEFFHRKGGRIVNSRLAKEWQKTDLAHRKRVSAGSMGGKAKSLKTNKTEPSNAQALPKQPEPEPEPDIKEEAKASLSSEDDVAATTPKPVDDVAEAVALYNAAASESGWPIVRLVNKRRRSVLLARLRECGGVEGWRDALSKAQNSNHCCGGNDRGWVANFDFLTQASSFTKLMEGNYDNRTGKTAAADDPTLRSIFRSAGAF